MKRRLMYLIQCLLFVSLLLFAGIPCQAMTISKPKKINSMEELLTWYSGLSGTTLQECGVMQPIACKGEIYLEETACRADITLLGGLSVPSGARLTIDNPNLVMMGPPPVITVEPGGVLCIGRLHPLVLQAMPQGGIVVQAGGALLMENEFTFADGVVIDQNPPPNTILPPVATPSPSPDETPLPSPSPGETPSPSPLPGETPLPSPPGATPSPLPPAVKPSPTPEMPTVEETLTLRGEVLKVTVNRKLFAILTIPRVDPVLTQTITIERSTDLQTWDTKYNFHWNEDGLDFRSEQTGEFGSICGRNRSDGSKTDFQYLGRLSGKPFYLRVILTGTDGQQTVSDAIRLTEPPVGQYSGSEDYEFYDGNRGGGGQGVTEREVQRQPEASSSGSTVTVRPQVTTHASAETGSVQAPATPTPAPEAYTPTASDTEVRAAVDAEDAVRLAQESTAEQSAQTVSEQRKLPDGFGRTEPAIAATFALCGGIGIIITKRKKP